MFVVQDLTIKIGSRAAQARFQNLLHGNWLAETSQVACEGGAEGLLRVGPAGPVAAKLVRVRFLDAVYRGDVMTVGLRWEAAGAAGILFPALYANISFSPSGDKSARLALAGSYRPPLADSGPGLTGPSCTEWRLRLCVACCEAWQRRARQPCPGRAPP